MSIHKGGNSYQHWCTPREVVDALHSFAPIDLDPCSNEHSIVNAGRNVCGPPLDDGLEVFWTRYAHTFVNPPYGRGEQERWLQKAHHEHTLGAKHITMLIPAAVETKHFRQYVWGTASAVAFWNHRIRFTRGDGKPDTGNKLPSALVYWGGDVQHFASKFRAHAVVVTSWVGP